MWKSLLLVALGGGTGSALRYAFSLWLNSGSIKWIPTLLVNVLGCLLLGSFISWHHKGTLDQGWYILLGIGFCGGLTTFSTFSAELFEMIKQNQYGPALIYFVLSTVLGVLAVVGGYSLVKSIA